MLGDYPASAAGAVEAFRAGKFDLASQEFSEQTGTLESDEFLALAEEGMVRFVSGDLDDAVYVWLQAGKVLDAFWERPTVSGRSLSENALSFVVNDKTLPYDGEGFEVALLHAYLAWTFLLKGDLDGAAVEVRKGYVVQQVEEERYESEYGMNRFARFVSALTQEQDRAYDEAELDLVPLAEALPDNQAVSYSLERVRRLQSGAGGAEFAHPQLIVIYEQGQMPQKIAKEFVYPTGRTFGRISVPAFGPPRPEARRMRVELDGQSLGEPQVVEDVLSVARANLQDRIAWLTAKTIGRSAAKSILIGEASRNVAKDQGDFAGFMVGMVGGLISTWSERADLRSWLTLPVTIQVLRAPVEPGTHAVRLVLLDLNGGEHPLDLGEREFVPGRPVLVSARSLGSRLWADAYGGAPPPQPTKIEP